MVTRPVATCPLVTQAENGAAASQWAGAGAGAEAEAGAAAEGVTISPRMPGVPQGFVRQTVGCGPGTSSRDRGARWSSHPVPRFCVGGGGGAERTFSETCPGTETRIPGTEDKRLAPAPDCC